MTHVHDVPIVKWNELKPGSWQSLLIGNGASIAIYPGFGYGTLLEHAKLQGYLKRSSRLFAKLDTSDFEYVLMACWHASIVNSALRSRKGKSCRIQQSYKQVRKALIKAVHNVHCDYRAAVTHLDYVARFLGKFENVFTLNYDLLVYWAGLRLNSLLCGTTFKDGFINQGRLDPVASNDWLRNPKHGHSSTTFVYYVHGNLTIARDLFGYELKLSAQQAGSSPTLLNTITTAWNAGKYVPVFVSEGTSEAKLKSIRRSPYLSFAYDNLLTRLGKNVVVYGFSFSDNDAHIVQAINDQKPQQVAVSVFSGLTSQEKKSFCHKVKAKLQQGIPVDFFESNSSGCWNNP